MLGYQKIPVACFALSHEPSCNSNGRLNKTHNNELIVLTNEIKVDPLSYQGIRKNNGLKDSFRFRKHPV